MPFIVVSSLDAAADAFARHQPGYVISILDTNDVTPAPFRSLPKERHLRLDQKLSETDMAPAILKIARDWATSNDNILIHCHRGVARSMAIAYILTCVREGGVCEQKIAKRLREAAPHADPNVLLVSEADAILGRDDRMVTAILDMCPCCSTVAAPVVTLPVAP
ncbi:hypothetical protein [Hyphococcus sp.]|uniref:hypothetical protein n=1 Tax=Hyphococcus sp. TaxID=2038636 RepID=UPI00208403FB|nr:MAG: hypothetical protein DHS20C04_12350 [Marinicaulis sp.]